MNTSLKLGLVLSSFLLLAACETPPADGGNTGGAGNNTGGMNDGMDSSAAHDLAPGVADRVFFATNSSTIDSEAKAVLERQAGYLKSNPSVNVVVEGHADERGTREFNIALGERRANAAKKYLTGLGVSAARLSTVSYGKERPAVMGSDEASWAQNRRAVTVLAK